MELEGGPTLRLKSGGGMGSMGGRTGVPGGEGLFCAVLCLDCCGHKVGFPLD
jgi:hypothetical protein